jgi:predicted ATP-binding protein involved in virulence
MKILSFTGTKVHDYLSLNVEFNSDLSIITGSNGSGKTTAIILLQAILCPNFKDLISIPFDTLELKIIQNEVITTITVKYSKEGLSIEIDKIPEVLQVIKPKLEEFEFMAYKNKEGAELNDLFIKNLSPHPVIEFIISLPSPIFIGLERRTEEIQNEKDDFLLERRMFINKSRHEFTNYKRQFKGTLGVSLLETEYLIQAMYKKIKRIEDGSTDAIQKQLLLSYFEYIPFDPSKDLENVNNFLEKRNLLSRRQEIEDALRKIGYNNTAFVSKLKPFFDKMEELIDKVNSEDSKGISIEWLINKSQVEKLSQLVEIIDDYNSKVSKVFKPIRKFIGIINSFIKDTGKKIYIDEVGHLIVKRPNGKDVLIDALSSGERQIVILFANVMFNKYSSEGRENILIIDEPELSLHIKWQEKFIETLLTASEKTQFILATHSPDIIGEHKIKNVKINKLVKNAK